MKYNFFDYPHRAIRNVFNRISTGIYMAESYDDYQRMIPLIKDLQFLLDSHLLTENDIIMPHVPGALQDMMGHEHEEIEEMQKALFAFMYAVTAATYEKQKYSLVLNFSHFAGNYLVHMHHEETVIQPYIWKSLSEPEQEKIVLKIVSKFSSEENLLWAVYGLPYVAQQDRKVRVRRLLPSFSQAQRKSFLSGIMPFIANPHFNELSELCEMDGHEKTEGVEKVGV